MFEFSKYFHDYILQHLSLKVNQNGLSPPIDKVVFAYG